MRKALILAFGLSLVGTSAWSQSSAQEDDYSPRGDYASSRDAYGHHNRWHGSAERSDQRDEEDRGGGIRDDGRPERGARFFLRSGDSQLRIICGNRDSTQACVDAALRLFDRVQSQGRTGPGPATTPPSAQ